jgi:hypothetical protein
MKRPRFTLHTLAVVVTLICAYFAASELTTEGIILCLSKLTTSGAGDDADLGPHTVPVRIRTS